MRKAVRGAHCSIILGRYVAKFKYSTLIVTNIIQTAQKKQIKLNRMMTMAISMVNMHSGVYWPPGILGQIPVGAASVGQWTVQKNP